MTLIMHMANASLQCTVAYFGIDTDYSFHFIVIKSILSSKYLSFLCLFLIVKVQLHFESVVVY